MTEQHQLTRIDVLRLLGENGDEIKQRFHAKRLGLFGSLVRDEGAAGSDVDILVEFERPTFDDYMDLKFYLQRLLDAEVDLVMADTLKPRIRPHILSEVQYAEGL